MTYIANMRVVCFLRFSQKCRRRSHNQRIYCYNNRMNMPGDSYQPNLVDACGPAKLLQPRPTLCDPVGCSLPGSYVHGILQARNWSGEPFPPPGDLPDPRIKPILLHWQAGSLPLRHLGSPRHDVRPSTSLPFRGQELQQVYHRKINLLQLLHLTGTGRTHTLPCSVFSPLFLSTWIHTE